MTNTPEQSEIEKLRKQVERLTKINATLMDRVERTVDDAGSGYALFESNVVMQQTIRERTAELADLNDSLKEEIEDRKHAETLMREARDQANAANLAKSQFLANMSHEIRTPLTAMIGYAEIMREHKLGESEIDEYAKTICRNGAHLLTLINEILDLSKLEAGELELERMKICPVVMLDEVRKLLHVRSEGKGIELKIEHEWPLPEHVVGDETRIRQVLLNLVGNAIKFTEVGSVTITLSHYEEHGEDWICYAIKDTGIGISEDVIDRIFKPFQQADNSMARRFGGTGLGLAISQHLVWSMGGDIRAASVPGEGSTFSFLLPVGVDAVRMLDNKPTEHAPKAKPVLADGHLEGVRVLLVEDGPDNQKLIAFHLKKAGAVVEIADNGLLGVQAVEERGPFDAILMDMQMPEMDGYTAAAKLREQGCDLPIIALTAHAMKGDRERCLDAGCNEYLTKPVDRRALIDMIRLFLQSNFRHAA